ncbi:hypothetical protein ES288_A05G396600v1 [Gossypium darwinii]|uniref:Uncharacterized protein n=1 Tax=Gossypium darwinii TaxID=34276 RepID=A0A5D2GPL3_GOSDA|nr:hypothetical protein ES288_A05G396600v1 [Gossypium darwinii]
MHKKKQKKQLKSICPFLQRLKQILNPHFPSFGVSAASMLEDQRKFLPPKANFDDRGRVADDGGASQLRYGDVSEAATWSEREGAKYGRGVEVKVPCGANCFG